MRGSAKVFLLSVLMMLLASTMASAGDSLGLPVDVKTVGPGCTTIKFDGINYRIFTYGSYNISFERVDEAHHRIFILAGNGEPAPYCDLFVQWSFFPPVVLSIDMDGGSTYLLGTETGYAEK